MKILLDLQGGQTESRRRGIGRYSIALTRGMLRNAGDHEIWVAMTGGLPSTIGPLKEQLADVLPDERMLIWNTVTPTGDILWPHHGRMGQAQVLREAFLNSLQPDIIHSSSVIEGATESSVTTLNRHFDGPRTSATLYDLIPLLDARRYLGNMAVERWYHQRLAELRRADVLLAISESSQREGREVMGLPPERLVNIRAAADDIFVPMTISASREAQLRKQFLITKPFVMYTGGVDPRKNVFGLISAFAMLPEEVRDTYQLVMVGSGDPHIWPSLMAHVRREGFSHGEVVFPGFVLDEDMVALINLATAFVFPSQHEGFGLPPLEAMSCGIPTIAADTSSLPEVLGNPDALFDPHNTSDMAAKMLRVLTDDAFRADLGRRGLEQAKTFSWDESAKRALAAFESVVAKPARPRRPTPVAPHRPRLAFVTPLPPRTSQARRQLLHTVEEFDRHYDVHLVANHDGETWDFEGPALLVTPDEFDQTSGDFDRIVHHFANDPAFGYVRDVQVKHPGPILLDDYHLDRALACSGSHDLDPVQAWMETVIEAEGYDMLHRLMAARTAGEAPPRVALNRHVLESASGVMVTDRRIIDLARADHGDDFVADWISVPMLFPGGLVDPAKHAKRPVVAVFGRGGEQLVHRVVAAWLDSRIASDPAAELVVVGQSVNEPYGKMLARMLKGAGPAASWRLVPEDEALNVVNEIRFAVQLSTTPDPGTWRWVLDCRARGITVLTQDEIPDGRGVSQASLIAALEKTWDAEASGTRTHEFVPAQAETYRDAIERLHTTGRLAHHADVLRVAARQPMLDGTEWGRTVSALMRNDPLPAPQPQLLVDVSTMVRVDARTGVQRVVRSIALELLKTPPAGLRVEPVYCDNGGELRYARCFSVGILGYDAPQLRDDPVVARKGDVFLGLDVNDRLFPVQIPNGVVAEPMEAMLEQLRSIGVNCQFVLYDLIASAHPEWFPPGLDWFDEYIQRVVRRGDGLICISESTARDAESWIRARAPERADIPISWFHLGADIENSVPTQHVTSGLESRLAGRGPGPSIVMVGTLEPRKGHDQALAAFTHLWNEGVEASLVLVGRLGWGRDDLRPLIRNHPEWNKRLFWFSGVSDAELMELYKVSDGCLMASRGEGFGLPLIEAARYDIPVLARDLPVFEEIAADNVSYFSGDSATDLADALKEWFAALAAGTAPHSAGIQWLTWGESTKQFLAALEHNLSR